MVSKKMGMVIGVLLLVFTTGFYHSVDAAAPNVKDCMEGTADCSELDVQQTNDTKDSDDSSADTTIGKENGSLLFEIVKMVFALLLVIALIYVLLKFLNKRNKLFSQVKSLENIGGISVGQNKSIQIVRIGTKMYVIGVGENVEMLQELTDEQVKKDLLHTDETKDSPARTLVTTLFQSKSDGDRTPASKQNSEFKKLFSTELEKMKQGRKNTIKQHKQKEDKHE